MKKTTVKFLIVLIFAFIFSNLAHSQVGIGTITPNESALLDLVSTDKGLLLPRMTAEQRDLINDPENSLIIYNITDRCFQAYNDDGGIWENIYCFGDCNPSIHTHLADQTICAGTNTSFFVSATGLNISYQWQVYNGGVWSDITSAGNNPTYDGWTSNTLLVNGVIGANSGIMFRCVVTGDCSPPAISNFAELTVLTPPESPEAAAHVVTANYIEWNWEFVPGALGYSYNFVDDSTSSIDLGLNNTFTQTEDITDYFNYLYVWAYDACGYSEVVELIVYIEPGEWLCGHNLYDERDHSLYATVLIGEQCWMAENLNIGEMIDNSISQSDPNVFQKYCYENDINNCNLYGGLYQWTQLNQDVCPDGWKVPSDLEWRTMEIELGMDPEVTTNNGFRGTDQGDKLKSDSDWNGTNASGFNALPGGLYSWQGQFQSLNTMTSFWTPSGSSGFYRELSSSQSGIARHQSAIPTSRALHVRCIKE